MTVEDGVCVVIETVKWRKVRSVKEGLERQSGTEAVCLLAFGKERHSAPACDARLHVCLIEYLRSSFSNSPQPLQEHHELNVLRNVVCM